MIYNQIEILKYLKMRSCIFEQSKYYKKAKANALSICAPLGYQFVCNSQSTATVSLSSNSKKVTRGLPLKPIIKQLSKRKTPLEKVVQFLQRSPLPRKTNYIQSNILEFLEKETNTQIINMMAGQYMPSLKPEWKVVELGQLLGNPGLESLMHVEDYALSKYFYLYQGAHQINMNYFYELFNRRLIEYPIHCVHVSETPFRARSSMTHYPSVPPTSKPSILQLISEIKKRNTELDPLYAGLHFYFCDHTAEIKPEINIFQREIKHLHLMQYNVTMITGLLADGQSAVFKLVGSFRQKTSEYLFLLKLAFNGRVSLVKPVGSNPFTTESYVVCEYYNKENGDYIHQYLIDNYWLLGELGEDELLLSSKKIFKDSLFENIREFNNGLFKTLQTVLKDFKSNPKTQFYPLRSKIIDRLPSKFCQHDELLTIINDTLPPEEQLPQEQPNKFKQKEQKKAIQKEGDTSLLSFAFSEKKEISIPKKKEKKDLEKNEREKLEQFRLQKELQKKRKKQKRDKSKKH